MDNPLDDGASAAMESLVARGIDLLQRGEALDLDELAAGRPELRERLAALLPMLETLARLDDLPRDQRPPLAGRTLGDFQLVREIGRGGMGIVFEAVQISLARRVAVKVLPHATLLHGRARQRFEREARAASLLRHPHIVPIFAVGCEDELHYYAMQRSG